MRFSEALLSPGECGRRIPTSCMAAANQRHERAPTCHGAICISPGRSGEHKSSCEPGSALTRSWCAC